MRRAIDLAIGLTVAWHVALFAADAVLPPLGTAAWPDAGGAVVNLVAAAVPAVVLWRSGRWRSSWLRRALPSWVGYGTVLARASSADRTRSRTG